jgi:hypothetical protein
MVKASSRPCCGSFLSGAFCKSAAALKHVPTDVNFESILLQYFMAGHSTVWQVSESSVLTALVTASLFF